MGLALFKIGIAFPSIVIKNAINNKHKLNVVIIDDVFAFID